MRGKPEAATSYNCSEIIFVSFCFCPVLRSVLRSGRNGGEGAHPMGTCSQAECTHDFKGDLQVGTVRGTERVEALSLVPRRHCLAGDQEGLEAGSREQTGLAVPHQPHSVATSLESDLPPLRVAVSGWQDLPYSAWY